ncbi:MAG TPA: hydroxyacid dehydrogenase, partial [Duganella sp.]|nr:hydroxyacid dehydrogenase [Duganella sp.]
MPEFLTQCRSVVGDSHVLDTDADMAPFLTDWRGRFTGKAAAVLRPGSVEQVAALVKACA